MAGGGPLLDVGIHVLDLALHLLGEPKVLTVSASTHAELGGRDDAVNKVKPGKYYVGSKYEVEDLATAFLRLADGTTLLLEASWAKQSSTEDDFGDTIYRNADGVAYKVNKFYYQKY